MSIKWDNSNRWQWMRGAERGYRLHQITGGKARAVLISGSRNGSLKDVPSATDASFIEEACTFYPGLLRQRDELLAEVARLKAKGQSCTSMRDCIFVTEPEAP